MAEETPDEVWARIRSHKTVRPIPIPADGVIGEEVPEGVKRLRFVCISDTHEQLGLLEDIPHGDVLIHAGDFTNSGDEDKLLQFNEELGRLPHKYKIVVAGNHELGFEDGEDLTKRGEKYKDKGTPKGYSLLTNATVLQDKEVQIEGIRVYGSSWHPLPGFSFSRNRGRELAEKWKLIPDGIQVLVTHSPPLGYLDTWGESHNGCADLLEVVERVRPRFHVFGHVHECYGVATNGETTFVNASICYPMVITNRPVLFDIPILPS